MLLINNWILFNHLWPWIDFKPGTFLGLGETSVNKTKFLFSCNTSQVLKLPGILRPPCSCSGHSFCSDCPSPYFFAWFICTRFSRFSKMIYSLKMSVRPTLSHQTGLMPIFVFSGFPMHSCLALHYIITVNYLYCIIIVNYLSVFMR